MSKVIVIGSSGQLASELRLLSSKFPHYTFRFVSQSESDIANISQLASIFQEIQPHFAINCAAYTAVDKAETDSIRAFEINELGALNVANLCAEYSCHLIHISTDFVFDGSKSRPYVESDSLNPLSIYGQSKLKGELAIPSTGCRYHIIRTSWLYSSFGHNFVKTMLRLGKEKETINVVDDQIGTPTYCGDLAEFILSHLSLFPEHENAIYHYSNEGTASWYDFAFEIMNLSGTKCKVVPIPSAAYPTPAVRPAYSIMSKNLIKQTYKISIPHWKESLNKCIGLLPN